MCQVKTFPLQWLYHDDLIKSLTICIKANSSVEAIEVKFRAKIHKREGIEKMAVLMAHNYTHKRQQK